MIDNSQVTYFIYSKFKDEKLKSDDWYLTNGHWKLINWQFMLAIWLMTIKRFIGWQMFVDS